MTQEKKSRTISLVLCDKECCSYVKKYIRTEREKDLESLMDNKHDTRYE